MEQGTGTALLGWSWRGEHVCMDEAGRRGSVALWLKAHGQLLLTLLVAWLGPSVAPSSTLNPCLRSALPSLCPIPPRAGLAEGLTAGNGVGKTLLCQHTAQATETAGSPGCLLA